MRRRPPIKKLKRRFVEADLFQPLSERVTTLINEAKTVFRLTSRNWQEQAIQATCNKQDVLIRADTDSGKSLTY